MPESFQPSSTPEQQDTSSNGHGDIRTPAGLSRRFVDILGWIITGFWSLSMGMHAINIGYEPPISIHVLMMTVAGAAFGTSFIRTKNGGVDGTG